MHHSFYVENICKIFVGIQGWVNRLKRLDGTGGAYMLALFLQTRLLL